MAGESAENMAKTQKGTKKKKHKLAKSIPIIILEVFILTVACFVLYVVLTATKDVQRTEINKEDIIINEEVVETKQVETTRNPEIKGYRNIALFGVDSRNGELGRGTRSDTIIIASINLDTQEIKLISVFRDTYLNLGNDSYNKCNTAYANGGPEQAINMLNTNLDLDITDYVTVGFSGLIDAVNALGGVEMDVTDEEIKHLNNYQLTMSEKLGIEYTPVEHTGRQVLNGLQATAYCRIRYTQGNDFRRAERQRDVLSAMMDKAKGATVGELTDMVNAILPEIQTSLDVNEILDMLGSVGGYNVVASDGFPFENSRGGATIGSKGSCVIPDNLEQNVIALHQMLYPGMDYTPSKQVRNISEQITVQTDPYR